MAASHRLLLFLAGLLTLATVAGVAVAAAPLPLWQRLLLGTMRHELDDEEAASWREPDALNR